MKLAPPSYDSLKEALSSGAPLDSGSARRLHCLSKGMKKLYSTDISIWFLLPVSKFQDDVGSGHNIARDCWYSLYPKDEESDNNHCKFIHYSSERQIQLYFVQYQNARFSNLQAVDVTFSKFEHI